MLDWFEKEAPIRAKFKTLLILLTTLSAISFGSTLMAVSQAEPSSGLLLGVSGLVTAATFIILMFASSRVCTPYVNTVLRMEALAAGDTHSPIQYTDYKDCVGRMTKAMATFRDNAVEVQQNRESQQRIVDSLSMGLKKLADNDLDYQIREPFPGAYEELRLDFNNALASLASAIRAVRGGAMGVLNGASEIRAASDDLANRNEQQAASLEETAAAMNQVTSSVRETASSAAEVQHSITEAHKEATDGGAVVQRAISAMAEIEKSAQEITQIINVIDGIAFQTNLLALNAGVEAARAGDAGKGFAVVASEVRALAQRSADAARDIKELITTSTEQVSGGVALVGETGNLLSRIVTRVGEINGLIADIATAASSQASSLQQVNSAVGDMDRMTQQNAAMVEQSTAASRSLAGEAESLMSMVAQFRTGDEGGASRRNVTSLKSHTSTPSPRSGARSAPRAAAPATHGNLAFQAAEDNDWTEF